MPMFIAGKKGLKQNGKTPADDRLWRLQRQHDAGMEPDVCVVDGAGRLVCLPNLRGGGEYGEDWHKAGHVREEAECLRRLLRGGAST